MVGFSSFSFPSFGERVMDVASFGSRGRQSSSRFQANSPCSLLFDKIRLIRSHGTSGDIKL